MLTTGQKIKQLRNERGITQTQLGMVLGVEKSTVSLYENNNSSPNYEILKTIATYFGVTTDYLLGHSSNPNLNKRDERDIARKLDSILNEMNSSDALMFDGEEVEMDQESKDLIAASIENSLKLAKKLAKEKYTPKKYK